MMLKSKWLKQSKFVLSILACLALTGCKEMLDEAGLYDHTLYPPAYPIDNPAPPKTTGAIYQSGHQMSLYQDHIAARIGDVITVRLEETTTGAKKSKTKANKKTTDSITIPHNDYVNDLDYVNNQEFDGQGESNVENRLRGTISVTVIRVLANGNLQVQGESWLTLNQGREYVRLTGIVRREDIDANNAVSSQRLANARITYSGNGMAANATRGGIFTQMLFKFFPY